MKSEDILPLGRKAITNLDSVKKQWHYSADKGHIVRAMVFPVVMYGCESWTIKKAEWQWIDAFKLWCWRVPWRVRRSNQSISGFSQLWILFGRTDAEPETPVFWSYDSNSWFTGYVPDAGRDEGQKEKRASEGEVAGWLHWCNGHELGHTLGDGEGQRGLACCSPQGSVGSQRVEDDWVTE